MGQDKANETNKRKKPWLKSGRDGTSKRHKGAMEAALTAKGSSGIVVSCDRNRERESVRDALNILNDIADTWYPTQETDKVEEEKEEKSVAENTEETKIEEKTVAQELQDEIHALKESTSNRSTGRFKPLDTGVRGVVLIQILDTNIPAIDIVKHIVADVEKTKEFASRYIQRMIPLQKICYAGMNEIKQLVEPMITKYLSERSSEDVMEYAIDLKIRNGGLEKMKVIDEIAALIDSKHIVNLSKPGTSIIVEVLRNTCGISIVENYQQYRKFNLRSIIEPPISEKSNEKIQNTVATSEEHNDKIHDAKSTLEESTEKMQNVSTDNN